eukprot:TRINITY_DN27166_c0_g1_i2.p1 TRINITY_DN27166_c0_g1~~TRINITY_DN27166_c0_g1_i2.p1  ORF type:complete len:149 (+),score=21.63 TRINITY_DN27166_c0_g1_i2:42-449(+)
MSALRSLQRSRDALQLLAALKLPAPWQRHDWCLFCCRGKPPSSAKVAGFDFDKTLHFGGPAWRLSSAHIPSRLKQLDREGGGVGGGSSSERQQVGDRRPETRGGSHPRTSSLQIQNRTFLQPAWPREAADVGRDA